MGVIRYVRTHQVVIFCLVTIFAIKIETNAEDFELLTEFATSVLRTDVAREQKDFIRLKAEKVCSVVKRKLALPYVDEDHESEIHEYKFQYKNGNNFVRTALLCATLPLTYVRIGSSTKEIIVTSIIHDTGAYQLSKEIIQPSSIFLDHKIKSSNGSFNNMRLGSRQQLCMEARKHVAFVFVDYYVLRPQTYTYIYHNEKRVYNAIRCLTYPLTYLRLETGTSANKMIINQVKMIYDIELFEKVHPKLHEDQFEQKPNDKVVPMLMEFEEQGQAEAITKGREDGQSEKELNRKLLSNLDPSDRRNMCLDAQKYIHYEMKIPEIVDEATTLRFEYANKIEKEHFAICCSIEGLKAYLYLTDLNSLTIAIRRSPFI